VAQSPAFLCDGDAFLLCTDGVWESIEEAVIERLLGTSAAAADWLAVIEAEVLRRARPRYDNYSAIAVRVSEMGDATRLDTL
jgi:serine/threonine protein phosphatase PrpC